MKDVPSIVVFQLNKTIIKKTTIQRPCMYELRLQITHTYAQTHDHIYIFTIST